MRKRNTRPFFQATRPVARARRCWPGWPPSSPPRSRPAAASRSRCRTAAPPARPTPSPPTPTTRPPSSTTPPASPCTRGTQVSVGVVRPVPRLGLRRPQQPRQRVHAPARRSCPTSTPPATWEPSACAWASASTTRSASTKTGATGAPCAPSWTRPSSRVIDAALAAAYRVDDHLSLGVALNVYYGELMLSRNVTLGRAAHAGGQVPPPRQRLRRRRHALAALQDRRPQLDRRLLPLPVYLHMAGDARLSAPGVVNLGPSHAVTSLDLPQSAAVGYSVRATDALRLEADVVWTDWDTFHSLEVRSPDTHFNQTLPANWRSGFTFRVGGEYELNPHWALRAGYAYSQNSVPESTYSPLVPDTQLPPVRRRRRLLRPTPGAWTPPTSSSTARGGTSSTTSTRRPWTGPGTTPSRG